MKKWLLFFVLFAFSVLVAFSAYVYLYRAEFVANSLSRIYGTPVKIAKVRFTRHGVKLDNVVVYNPSQYALQPALSIADIELRMDKSNLLAAIFGFQPAIIRQINIVDPLFGIEMKNASGTDNNWVELLQNVVKNADTRPSGRSFEVHTITFLDIAIEVKNRALTKPMKRPSTIDRIVLGRTDSAQPVSASHLVYWASKLTLAQIGQKMAQTDFTASIENVPNPQKQPTSLKLLRRKKHKSTPKSTEVKEP